MSRRKRATPAPPLSPATQQVLRTDNGLLHNALSRLGAAQSRTQQTRVGQRRLLKSMELDALWQSKMVKRFSYELPSDASSPPKLSCADIDTQQVEDLLDELNVAAVFVEAQALATHYGGAAVWVVMEGVDPAKPLAGQTIGKVQQLVVIERFEMSVQSTGATYYQTDPSKPDFGLPTSYLYAPSQAGGVKLPGKDGSMVTQATPIIHSDHLIRFYGDSVPRRLQGFYDGWGAPILEGLFDTWSQLEMAKLGGAELAHEFGMMVYSIPNLHEILSGGKLDEFYAWMQTQTLAKSTIRGMVMGMGQTAERSAIPLTGWVEIYDRIAQFLASELGMPVVKLYGQAPGGLSTDDASAWRQWSRKVENYQTTTLRKAYNRILELLFRSTEGPTRGELPTRWMVEFEGYEVPSAKEEGEALNIKADALTKLDALGAITQEEIRATVRMMPGLSLASDDEFEAQQVEQGAALLASIAAPALSSSQAREGSLTSDAEDSYVPPIGVQQNAKRALEVRASKPPSQRAMTPVGLARARDLANGRPLTLDTLRRMVDYFTRHEVDKQSETWSEQGKGWQAWMGWGGDEGWRWARTIVEREDKREDALVTDPYFGPDDDLPPHIARLKREERALWVQVCNATWKRTRDEGRAFAVANSAVGVQEEA